MNAEYTEQQTREHWSEIRLLTANDALKLELRPIEVPENAELVFSPANREYSSCFARVLLKTYEDLQTLGFVPRKLAEQKLREAMAMDDEETYQLAGKMLQSSGHCDCSKPSALASISRVSPIRTVYNSIRKKHNAALARLLTDHYGARMSWDSPVVGSARKWALGLRNIEVIIAAVSDIIIHKNATLAVAAKAKSLMARNIYIHSTGRLVGQGSYLKIWANSIDHFSFLNLAAVAAAQAYAPVWSTKSKES